MYNYQHLQTIVEVEFANIVLATEIIRQRKLRIILIDSSFKDVFYSPDPQKQFFAYHWERSHIDGTIYRHDNVPDGKWEHIDSFPKHFHDGYYENVKESSISDAPAEAMRFFLSFVESRIKPNIAKKY